MGTHSRTASRHSVQHPRFRKQRQTQRGLTRKRQGCSNQIPKRQADLQLGSKSVNLRKYAEPNLIIFSSILGIPTHAVIICARGRNLSVILGIKRSVTRNLSRPKVDLMRSFNLGSSGACEVRKSSGTDTRHHGFTDGKSEPSSRGGKKTEATGSCGLPLHVIVRPPSS